MTKYSSFQTRQNKIMYLAVMVASFLTSWKIFNIALVDFCNGFSMLPVLKWHIVFVVAMFIPSLLLLLLLKIVLGKKQLSVWVVTKMVFLYLISLILFCSLLNTFLRPPIDTSIEHVLDVTDTSLRKYAAENGSLPSTLESIKEDQDFQSLLDSIVYKELVYTPKNNDTGFIHLFKRTKKIETWDTYTNYSEMLIPGCGW